MGIEANASYAARCGNPTEKRPCRQTNLEPLLDHNGGDAVVPGVSALLPYTPVVQVGDIITGGSAGPVEITIVENRDASIAKDADGRDFVSVVAHTLQALATTQAEESTSEAGLLVEACAAALPSTSVPFAAWRPSGTRLGLPPTTAISIVAMLIAVVTVAVTIISLAGSDGEDGAATLLNP